MTTPRLGRVQLMIMRVLWQRGRTTAREITDALNRRQRVAHSTVQTLLRKLEAKGAVAHEVDGRTFVFYPLVEERKVQRGATRELLERMFAGSPAGLVACLLEHEQVSREELDQIRQLIDRMQRT